MRGIKRLARTAAERIARERLGIEALSSRDPLKAALVEAYEAGWGAAHVAQRMDLAPGDIVVLSRPGRPGRQAGDK